MNDHGEKTVMQQIEEIMSETCDNYCRFPIEAADEDELELHCDKCPLVNLL